jgi:hypothetical protein
LKDEGRRGPLRQLAQLRLADGRNLGNRHGNVDLRLEENLDDANAVERLRLNVLNVIDRRCQSALALPHNALRHLLRRQAGIGPYHGDNGNINIRKNIRGRPHDRDRAQDQ